MKAMLLVLEVEMRISRSPAPTESGRVRLILVGGCFCVAML